MSMPPSDKSVALFSAYYPTHGGGMELATDDLARALLAAGLSVEWLAQSDGYLPPELTAYCTPVPGSDIIYSLSGVPLPIPMPWTLPTIYAATRRARIVIVAEANFLLSIAAFITAKLLRKPVLLIQHVGRPSTVSKIARSIMSLGERIATRPMVASADAVVYVSRAVARHFEDVKGSEAGSIIGHGIDTRLFCPPLDKDEQVHARERFGLQPGNQVACYIGRLTESKGLSVIADVAQLRPDWTFAVGGSGPLKPEQWGLPNVVVLGQLDREEVAALYRAADRMILPSQSESYSIVVREAMASGCSVLCADQILETDEGLAPFITTEFVDLADVRGTAKRFAAALDRRPRESGDRARAYIVLNCSQAAAAAQYVQLAKSLFALKAGGRT